MSKAEMAREQEYVSRLYRRLDGLREQTAARLADVLRHSDGTAQGRWDREAAASRYTQRLARLTAAERGLCFGRLDFRDGPSRYIGRIGLPAEDAADDPDAEPLLLDWRAPAARPFYLATAVAPQGVHRRRHIRTQGRRVIDLNDELLDARREDADAPQIGEAALLAALEADRSGRMRDIVATIQAEQDAVIRSGHRGVLVVEGGPGTGKTVVALHRAAYLLYTHRDLLARRGVLIVGPNRTFLRYIEEVLPALGETGVLATTIGELFPGVRADGTEPPQVAEIKGRAMMAEVVAAAVKDRQWVPREALRIETEQGLVLHLDRATCERAREAARRSRLPHNRARPIVVRHILDALARQAADRLNAGILVPEVLADLEPGERVDDLFDAEDVAAIRRELAGDPAVHAALERLWPVLTPQRLLADLYSCPDRLASAAPGLSRAERESLLRDPSAPWTPADVPLLDEAAELLGADDRAARARAEAERRRRIAYAQGVLDVTFGSRSTDLDDDAEAALTAGDLVDAAALADRHEEPDPRTAAERAAADRTWAFGHIVVDEAQELSPMAWRLLLRRCPARWMTVVGDPAQTGGAGGVWSWAQVLDACVPGRWRLERLTVNYRTPAEFMDLAAAVRAELTGEDLRPPAAVRHAGSPPWLAQVPAGELPARLSALVAAELAALGGGHLAVVTPAALREELAGALGASTGPGEEADLRERLVVLTAGGVKGLEFDSVLVVEPARILAEGAQGPNDLFVALTRATKRMGIVHTGEHPLPAALTRLPSPPQILSAAR
ncbi:Superfamily I DNA and RNA helicase-like protein [Thermomonospora curvata DSM 43183]|uniref:Superfamily I DNA and RNA helicase-like protein n=2 Tax=Thermomonospora curvata TaxID=2020 RepID=D1ADD0_THECD|nr:Superfamily I DNA and RNA helicase-like protein [Thermomonospora curvata DSM 43183]